MDSMQMTSEVFETSEVCGGTQRALQPRRPAGTELYATTSLGQPGGRVANRPIPIWAGGVEFASFAKDGVAADMAF